MRVILLRPDLIVQAFTLDAARKIRVQHIFGEVDRRILSRLGLVARENLT